MRAKLLIKIQPGRILLSCQGCYCCYCHQQNWTPGRASAFGGVGQEEPRANVPLSWGWSSAGTAWDVHSHESALRSFVPCGNFTICAWYMHVFHDNSWNQLGFWENVVVVVFVWFIYLSQISYMRAFSMICLSLLKLFLFAFLNQPVPNKPFWA